MSRVFASLVMVLIGLGNLGSVALAGGGNCGPSMATPTPHSTYFVPDCDSVAVVGAYEGMNEKTGQSYQVKVVNSAKVGLTPLYNTLTVLEFAPSSEVGKVVWSMGFSMNFIAITSVPGFLVTVAEFSPGNEGFIVWDTSNLASPKPITGMSYQQTLTKATYHEISAISANFDWEITTITVAVNHGDQYGHLVGELFEYRLGPTGLLVSGRHWLSLYQIDDFTTTYAGNLEVAMHDPDSQVYDRSYFHVAYLATDDPTSFILIGEH